MDDVLGIIFSSTLQFIIVLVATALLDIIQLGLYFDNDLGSSISKYIVFSLDDPLIQELVTYFANYIQATDCFLQFFFCLKICSVFLLPINVKYLATIMGTY